MTGRDGKGNHWYQRRDGDEDIFFIAQPNGRSHFLYFKNGKFLRRENPVEGAVELEESGEDVPLISAVYEPYESWLTHRDYLHWFTAPEKRGRFVLSLGEVRDWATVKVNGKVAARLWCEPYSCDITSLVRPGKNEICVEVISTLYNRLVHEASFPEPKRTIWALGGPKAGADFKKAGHCGPVRLTVAH